MSFVIEGEIQHYDSKFDRWLTLSEGDAQIIRSGKGITHAERIMEGGRMFQVWFDPDVQKAMQKEATYDDYKSEDMKYYEEQGILYKNYVGNGGPVEMDAEGVEINEMNVPKGKHTFFLDTNKIHSYYVLNGEAQINKVHSSKEHDCIIVKEEKEIEIEVNKSTKLFAITVPKKLTYKTYLELIKH